MDILDYARRYGEHDAKLIALLDLVGATSHPLDLARTAIALRMARQYGVYDVVLAETMAKRSQWRSQLFIWQRRWQRETRRASHARHHDSIAIRERYVRTRG